MKKEKYISPVVEVIELECDDVITASDPNGTEHINPGCGSYYGRAMKFSNGWWSTDNDEGIEE